MVTGGRPLRVSRFAVRRALVLVGVHLLIALHIGHWLAGNATLTPIEPSEAMEFSKHGLVNAGLVFFGLAAASTAVLGRWFCGWACHMVALQDLCRWALERIGIRPRPLRSSVLAIIPLCAFTYMFLMPVLYRMLTPASADHGWYAATVWTTTDFWKTFPGWGGALVTFGVCGFAAVYVLGAKGFCTYGCPYGALFGVADTVAPLRIRVTDACAACGHCTAVCTSNVRVHEEVRRFGHVVDPGCMKCLDCVAACPNQALFVGWSDRVTRPAARRAPLNWRDGALAWLFGMAALSVFAGHDLAFALRPIDALALALLALPAGVVGALGAPFAAARRDAVAEVLLAALFLLAALALRGAYGLVPFLCTLGLAAIVALLLSRLLLATLRPNVSLFGWVLRHHGRFRPAAGGATLLALAAIGLIGDAGLRQMQQYRAAWLEARLIDLSAQRAAGRSDSTLHAELIAGYQRLTLLRPHDADAYLAGGLLLTELSRFREADDLYQRGLRETNEPARLLTNYGLLAAVQGDLKTALRRFEQAAAADETLAAPLRAAGQAHAAMGDVEAALAALERAWAREPTDVDSALLAAQLSIQRGDRASARVWIDRLDALSPRDPRVERLRRALGE